MSAATYWNGLPTPARRGTAIVADAPEFPAYWARALVGQRIRVVEVVLDGVNYGGGIDYLDNRDGGGWVKVTEGRGSGSYGHASVAIEPDSFTADDPLQTALDEASIAVATRRSIHTVRKEQGL